jgi:hypothetical protein
MGSSQQKKSLFREPHSPTMHRNMIKEIGRR